MINYILFVVIAVLLFLVFRVARLLSYRIRGLKKVYAILVAIELAIWITFLFWMIHFFFKEKSYYNELLLVLVVTAVVLLVWFYIKDVVAGFLFRIKHNPSLGQILDSEEAQGVIKRMDPSQVFVEHDGGEVIRIPYSRLMGKSLILRTEDVRSASEVTLQLPVSGKRDQVVLEKRIRLLLLQSPWCVPAKPIKIEFTSGDHERIEISLHLVSKSFAEAAKARVDQLINRQQKEIA